MASISRRSSALNQLTIKVVGRFDFSLHEEFQNTYYGHVAVGTRVAIDLEKVEYMDSSALGMLLLLREYVGEDNADIRLIHASSEIRNILQVSNFDQLFKIE